MNFIKRFWIAALVLIGALALPYSAKAQDYTGFEGQASFYETIDGHFSPGMKVQGVMYANGFGMGAFYGKNKSAGPCFVWRAMQADISPSFYIAAHLGATTDLWQGYRATGEEHQANAAGYFEPRIGWAYLNGKVELGFPIQCLTVDDNYDEWTFGLTFSFMPNQQFTKAAAAPSASIEDELGIRRAVEMGWGDPKIADSLIALPARGSWDDSCRITPGSISTDKVGPDVITIPASEIDTATITLIEGE